MSSREVYEIKTSIKMLETAIAAAGARADNSHGSERKFNVDTMWEFESLALKARCELSAAYLAGKR